MNAGSLTLLDGSTGNQSDYQVLTTNATNNPNGLMVDVGAGNLATSNFKVDSVSGFTGTNVAFANDASFASNVNVTGDVNIGGNVNIVGNINSSNVTNLDVEDVDIRLAVPAAQTGNEKSVGDPTTSGLYIWSIPTGATEGDANEAANLYDKHF